MQGIHLHGGPFAGEHLNRPPNRPTIPVRAAKDGRHWRGHYEQDSTSAGGRCYDWHDD